MKSNGKTLAGCAMDDLRQQGVRSSDAHECHQAVADLVAIAAEGLLEPAKASRALLRLQKLYPSTLELVMKAL